MSVEIWIVLAIIGFALIAFAFELFRNDLVALLVMSLLIVTGILTPTEATRGFSSSATLTVACMFIVSSAFVKAGLLGIASRVLNKWKHPNSLVAMLLLMLLVGLVSAFINNTAAVAVFIPIAIQLAHTVHSDRRAFLMPLSFAAIFGGACTLIGTSTNILVNSVYVEHGFPSFHMFEFAGVGICLSLIGFLYMGTIGRWLLHSPEQEALVKEPRGYLTEVSLLSNSPSVGKTLRDSPFFRDFETNIMTMKRGEEILNPSTNYVLKEGDHFLLMCGIEKILSLRSRIGLSVLEGKIDMDDLPSGMEIFEVVVPNNSNLIGQPLNHSGRVRATGIIPLAVRHRQLTLFSLLRRARIQAGDVLVVASSPDVFEGFRSEENLLVLSQPKGLEIDPIRLSFTIVLLTLLIGASAFGFVSILGGAILVCALLLVTKTISLRDAYESLDSQVLLLLSCVISLGFALEKTGGAKLLAEFLTNHAGALGPYALVSLLYLSTSLLTEVISNNATAILMAPIALDIASRVGLESKPFLVAVMMAGSASFMTPVGYQTNTLIFAPGGYRFADFLKVGIPLNLLFWGAATFLIPYFFPFH
jgi:di/tricarboxylate transporter